MTKVCMRCNENKSVDLFCKNRLIDDGFNIYCKQCVKNERKIHLPITTGCKVCVKCKENKQIDSYPICSGNSDGRTGVCVICINNRRRAVGVNKETRKMYESKNKDKILETNRKRYLKNKDEINRKRGEYNKRTKQERDASRKRYYEENIGTIKEKKRIYKEKNKTKIKEYHVAYSNKRRSEDPLHKMKCYLRSRIWFFFKRSGVSKSITTEQMLGCSYLEAKLSLESKFTDGMSWINMGEWHIDHVVPLSSAKTETELMDLCHYTNLQPLWAIDNIKKGNKII